MSDPSDAKAASMSVGHDYAGLYDRFPYAVVVVGNDGTVRYVNAVWLSLLAMPAGAGVGFNVFNQDNDFYRWFSQLVRRALAGETLVVPPRRFDSHPYRAGAGPAPLWLKLSMSPVLSDGGISEVVVMHEDVSAQITAQERLSEANLQMETRIAERTRELSTLLDVSRSVTAKLDLRSVLNEILDQLSMVVEYTGAAILVPDEHTLTVLDARWEGEPDTVLIGRRLGLRELAPIIEAADVTNPVIIGDLHADEPLAAAWRAGMGDLMQDRMFAGLRSLLSVPLPWQGEQIGGLSLVSSEPGYYTPRHGELARAFAAQAAVAIQNARLFEDTARRGRELQSLVKVATGMTATLNLEALLGSIIDRLNDVIDFDGAAVLALERNKLVQIDARWRGRPLPLDKRFQLDIDSTWMVLAATYTEPIIVNDLWSDEPGARLYRRTIGDLILQEPYRRFRGWLGIPLVVNDRSIGQLTIASEQPGYYTPDHVQLAMAFAAQAAIAITNARLFTEAEQRSTELSTLLDVAGAVSSTLDLPAVMDTILEQLQEVVDYRGATIGIFETNDQVLVVGSRAVTPERTADLGRRFPFSAKNPVTMATLGGRPVIVNDVLGDTKEARAFREINHQVMEEPTHRDIRAWMAVPLAAQGKIFGHLTMSQDVAGYFTEHHAEMAMAFARQAAIAIANARLFTESERRGRELATLLDLTGHLTSKLDLPELLSAILEDLNEIVPCTAAVVLSPEAEDLVVLDARWNGVRDANMIGRRFAEQQIVKSSAPLTSDTVFSLADVRGDEPAAVHFRTALGPLLEREPYRELHAVVGLPLIAKGQNLGSLVLSSTIAGYFTDELIRLAAAFAGHAANAINNARLYAAAQETAALEERQRLARELHDSVSQALFGISLGAKAAREWLDRDPQRARRPVEYVQQLATAGAAEMRALLFELRPESLAQEGLVAALAKQAAALRARHQVEVVEDLCAEPDAPLAVKEAFYRVAQEAMHNTVKHAGAGRIDLTLQLSALSLMLTVRDNGRGFDASARFPGHLGLISMRERAERIGAQWQLTSTPGTGVLIEMTYRL